MASCLKFNVLVSFVEYFCFLMHFGWKISKLCKHFCVLVYIYMVPRFSLLMGHLYSGLLAGREKWISYSEGQIRLGLDQNFIHFWPSFINGMNKIAKKPAGRGPLPGLSVVLYYCVPGWNAWHLLVMYCIPSFFVLLTVESPS
jgi:hypothetical protein